LGACGQASVFKIYHFLCNSLVTAFLKPITNSTSRSFSRWQLAAWLRVTGVDAATFLQGQFTNDLSKGGSVYGLWLNVKGKVLADSFVLRGPEPDTFWIGSTFSPAAVIKERLEAFIIADDVVVEDLTPDWRGVTALGPVAMELLENPPQEGRVFRGRRGEGDAAEWIFPEAARAAVDARLHGVVELDAEELERRRIGAGIPAVPRDIGPGDLPNEGGLEADAISYTKGCYLGQEVLARLKSMGQVRRRLVRVRGPSESWPALPAPLFAGGRQGGELRSAVRDGAGGFIGLAMVSRLHVSLTTALAFAVDAPPTIQLQEAP
jgi:folate-binding protein YgfZ